MASKLAALTLGQFGVQFVRQVFNPTRIAQQIAKQLPPPTNGTVALTEAGVGTASYTAKVQAPYVQASTRPGLLRVTMPIEVQITLKLVISRTFHLRAEVPFWMEVLAYKPLVLFLQTSQVQEHEINIALVYGGGDWLSDVLWKEVQKQIRPMLAKEVNTALAGSYPARVIDLLKTMQASETRSLEQDEVLPAVQSGADEPPAGTGFAAADVGASEPSVEPPESIFWESPATYAADTRNPALITYEQFGGAMFYHLVSPQTVKRELNAMLQKNPPAPKVTSDFNWAIAVPSMGSAWVQYLGQNEGMQRMKAVIPIRVDVNVFIGHIWREGWRVGIEVPLQFHVKPYDQPLMIFLGVEPVSPASLAVSSQQLTNTGIGWGVVEEKLRTEVAAEVNKSLEKSVHDRQQIIEKLVKEALKE